MARSYLACFREEWKWARPIWRVATSILTAQIVGSILGVATDLTGELFFNLWYGAAYAMPVGLILGLLWQAVTDPRGLVHNVRVLLLLGVISIALPLFGFLTFDFWGFPRGY